MFRQEGKQEVASWGRGVGGGRRKQDKYKGGSLLPLQQRRGQAARQPGDTHPHDHHLHRDVLGEADRGPEVCGQRHEQVQDGHQVLPMDCWSGEGRKEAHYIQL